MSGRRILARAVVAALVLAAAGIVLSAWHIRATGRQHARRRALYDARDDEDDNAPPSAIELEMLDRNDFLACDRAHALQADHEGDQLCPPS